MRFRLTPRDFSRLIGMAIRTGERTELAALRAAYDRAFERLSRAVRAAEFEGDEREMCGRVEAAKLSYLRARNLMAAFLLQRRQGAQRELGYWEHRATA
jgi:hypothetical protein